MSNHKKSKERERGGNKKGTYNKKDIKEKPMDNTPQAGNLPPKFKWYKEGVEIASVKNNLKDTKLKKKKEGKVSELLFRKATNTHAGSYTCEAFNNLGKNQHHRQRDAPP
ncbi:unnamed protein product, partial [Coregonus sp. 'balchen']